MVFCAHRDERRFYLLSTHLAHVAAGAAERLTHLPDGQELGDAAFLAGLAHDFGKYTGFFQRYLRTGRGGAEKQHAFLSGLWAACLAAEARLQPVRRLALFLAVIRHHQELVDPEAYLVAPRHLAGDWNELSQETATRLRLLETQVADLRQSAPAVARSLALAARHGARLLRARGLTAPHWLARDWAATLEAFLHDWVALYGELHRVWRGLKRQGERDLAAYFEVLSLFSALIDADKIHAARVREAPRPVLPADPVEAYRAARFGAPGNFMDALRDDLYRTVVSRVDQAPAAQRLFTITAPTGAGKTLAGLAAAFRLRARRAAAGRPVPRIIYALPFTSIVDQTFAVGEAVLRAASPEAAGGIPSSWLLKHHHLAEPVYREPGKEAEEHSLDASLLLIESWQSEVVVTTFVQLLQTLIGNENRMLKKFHRLGGAILILDEVQSIPVEYWPVVAATLRRAASKLDMAVILMTATRPEWFAAGEALELAGEPAAVRRRFTALDRVTVTADGEPLTVAQAAGQFLERHREGRAYLVVLNTIKSSIAFYQALRRAWGGEGPPLYYLSTNIVPAERERRLQEIRESLARGDSPVVVSTQVVEAGVDLDFDEVWRDLGPVDAVVQVAGRCNRHFRAEHGVVRLLYLVDDRPGAGERLLASYVYGPIHTRAARRLFTERPALAEPDFFDAVADYFRLVREGKSAAVGEDLLRAMAGLRFSREQDEQTCAVSDFALIRALPWYVDVFICADAAAEEIWERYRTQVAGQRDLRRRAEAFLALKRDFRRYLLAVPARLLLHRLPDDSRPPCVPRYLLDEFYDAETGFKRVDEEDVLIY